MSTTQTPSVARRSWILPAVIRFLVGGLFIYMGINKALNPVEFLKLVRQYDAIDNYLVLNLVAAFLPWFEVFCGILLVLGLAIRGAALVSVAMLVPFTIMVFLRALRIQDATGVPFCTIRFDCGCGTGEILICYKLLENTVLTLMSAWLFVRYLRPRTT